MTDDLSVRAGALTERIAALRRQRATAMLAGEAFDSLPIAAAEADLAALADAEGEVVSRERQAARAATARHNETIRAAVAGNEAARVAAVSRAEAAARAFVAAIDDARRLAGDGRALWRQLGGRVPAHLDPPLFDLRLSDRLASVLHKPGGPANFGVVSWRVSWADPAEDWGEAERRAGAAAVADASGRG